MDALEYPVLVVYCKRYMALELETDYYLDLEIL